MIRKLVLNWRTECLNTRLHLSILLYGQTCEYIIIGWKDIFPTLVVMCFGHCFVKKSFVTGEA